MSTLYQVNYTFLPIIIAFLSAGCNVKTLRYVPASVGQSACGWCSPALSSFALYAAGSSPALSLFAMCHAASRTMSSELACLPSGRSPTASSQPPALSSFACELVRLPARLPTSSAALHSNGDYANLSMENQIISMHLVTCLTLHHGNLQHNFLFNIV